MTSQKEKPVTLGQFLDKYFPVLSQSKTFGRYKIIWYPNDTKREPVIECGSDGMGISGIDDLIRGAEKEVETLKALKAFALTLPVKGGKK